MDSYEEIRKAADRSRQVHSTIGHLVQEAVVGSSRLGIENGENIVPQLCNRPAAQSKKGIQIFAEHGLCRRFTQKPPRSEENTSALQSLMRISYAVFCLKKKKHNY